MENSDSQFFPPQPLFQHYFFTYIMSTTAKITQEESIVHVQRRYFIGTFKVFLCQTKNHPDQRAIDQSWVNQLVNKIGGPDVLNRAIHPINTILEDDSCVEALWDLLKADPNSTPALPKEISVLVFAGQH
jgi:hypothetical protein